jgi:hypothetical protein
LTYTLYNIDSSITRKTVLPIFHVSCHNLEMRMDLEQVKVLWLDYSKKDATG